MAPGVLEGIGRVVEGLATHESTRALRPSCRARATDRAASRESSSGVHVRARRRRRPQRRRPSTKGVPRERLTRGPGGVVSRLRARRLRERATAHRHVRAPDSDTSRHAMPSCRRHEWELAAGPAHPQDRIRSQTAYTVRRWPGWLTSCSTVRSPLPLPAGGHRRWTGTGSRRMTPQRSRGCAPWA